MKSFLIALTRNPISLFGAAVVTATAILIVTLFTLELFGFQGGPYSGIIAYLIVPVLFIAGLLLIPLGIFRQRRSDRLAAARGEAPPAFPVLDLNDPSIRNRALIFAVLTALNIVILATATYKGVETMDTTQFCGKTCHSVMQPEFTAFQRSPHAHARCVDCHIGPGAGWFVKSKLSGVGQVVAVATGHYPRPIPTPVHNLRPARETCEQCHWPSKFVGDRIKVIPGFADDEANGEQKTVLLMRVGGKQGSVSKGIHWHVDPGVSIRYLSDDKRETIYEVEMKNAQGEVRRFKAQGDVPKGAVWRTMDCVDCHNRPSHTFHPPAEEVDAAMSDGRLPKDLPFLHRESIRLLKASYPSQEAARQGIAQGLQDFYTKQYPAVASAKSAVIRDASAVLGVIYSSNVFPAMDIGWGTYPNHIGHESSPGCFRCHDDAHKTADGRTISQDCSLCHGLLAVQEKDPAVLKSLQQ
ncbi:MAG TPA: NapC/NirT family cytochrome c [Thermoanaerobaculia bacterium]